MLKKLKEIRENKKGFTLVELIVVLVILAILAALLIPALTGYIDKAKEKQIIAETRQAVMAAQTVLDEKLVDTAKGDHGEMEWNADAQATEPTDTATDAMKDQYAVEQLAEVKGYIAHCKVDKGKVTELIYVEKNKGTQCTYKVAADGTSSYKVEKYTAPTTTP